MSQVKLNKSELRTKSMLPESMQSAFEAEVLKKKTELGLVDGSSEVAIKNRSEFSVTINGAGTIVVRGLGNRFPSGFRADSLSILLSHTTELQKAIVDAKAYLSNPLNQTAIKAFKAERTKQRRLANAKKQG